MYVANCNMFLYNYLIRLYGYIVGYLSTWYFVTLVSTSDVIKAIKRVKNFLYLLSETVKVHFNDKRQTVLF